VKFRCPNCKQRLHVANDWVGRKVACPACRSHIAVPAPPGAQPLVCPTCGNELVPGDKICKRCGSFVDGRRRLLTNMRDPSPSAQTTEIVAPRDLLDDTSTVRRAKQAAAPPVKSAEEFLSAGPEEEEKQAAAHAAGPSETSRAAGEAEEGIPGPASAEITSAVVAPGSRKHLWFVVAGAAVLIVVVLVLVLKGCG